MKIGLNNRWSMTSTHVMKENVVRRHVTELRGQADLGAKPISVQPIRGEVSSAVGKPVENPVFNHVAELKRQASLKGEPAPFQPSPAEQQAAERLGKPPPQNLEEVVETLSPEVEAAIRAYAMGDPEEEAQLREQVKNDPKLRDSLVNPGFGLVYRVPLMPPFLKDPDDA